MGETTTTTSASGSVTRLDFHITSASSGVLGETSDRLTYWRDKRSDVLTREESERLERECVALQMTIDEREARDEADDLRREAGFYIKDAIKADDWTKPDSRARHFDYLALVALARAKMLDTLADMLKSRDDEA